jgi:hypothetical protein
MKHSLALLLAMASPIVFGQAISRGQNRLGLDIQDVAVVQGFKVKITLKNASELPVTAYVLNITSAYSDGRQLGQATTIDFFDSLGLERSDSADRPKGALMPGGVRSSTVSYSQPMTSGARLVSLTAAVTSLVFKDDVMLMDDSVPGQSERIRDLFQARDAQSAEIMRWCPTIDQLSKAQVTREAFQNVLNSHATAPVGAAEDTRKALADSLQQGVEWGASGKGTLRAAVSQAISAQCNTAREYLTRRDPNSNQ